MRTLLKSLLLLFLTLSFACGSTNSGDQATDDPTTESVAVEENTDTDEEATDEEENSNRPSPPKVASGTVGDVSLSINYSSPSVKGRTIWGGLVPYGKVWRTGANEATTFEVSSDVNIEGQTLAAGKYALFTIPNADKWTVIFNSQPDQWGSYDRDAANDVLSVDVTPQASEQHVEAMEFVLEDGTVILKWEKLEVPIKVAPAG